MKIFHSHFWHYSRFIILLTVIYAVGCSERKLKDNNISSAIKSPEVHSDRTITFRLKAPEAKIVKLVSQVNTEFIPMKKGEGGIWSVTLDPLAPDIYLYSYEVDGNFILDPANPDHFTGELYNYSLVGIPENKPGFYLSENVSHGMITYKYSDLNDDGKTEGLMIYTPPDYDQTCVKKYPVFYLINEAIDNDVPFFKVGSVNFILDNLIASGKAKPMIVVIPNKSVSTPLNPKEVHLAKDLKFDDIYINNVLTFVEKNYRVCTNCKNRAIGGFSDGGCVVLRYGFRNLDKFSWICTYGAYLEREEFLSEFKSFYFNPKTTNEKLDLLLVGVGNDNSHYHQTVDFINLLNGYGISCKKLITTEGYSWMSAKRYLQESIQLLFQD